MTEKRTRSYPLTDVKAAFADSDTINRTASATRGAEDLDMENAEVVAVVRGLTRQDFDKSMTSYADNKVWQDVYKPTVGGRQLYVKFTLDAQGQLLMINFKEA